MFDPTSLTHRLKRGVTQAMHALGPNHTYQVYDEEYEQVRRTYLQTQTVLENAKHYLRQFETGMQSMIESLRGLSQCFQDFNMLYVEDQPSIRRAVPCHAMMETCSSPGPQHLKDNPIATTLDTLKGVSERLHAHLTTDYLNVITAMLALHEPFDDLHKEIRTFQADIEVLQNDVTHMRNVIEMKGCTLSPTTSVPPSDTIAFSQVQQQKEIALSQWQKLIVDGKGRVRQYNNDTHKFLWNLFSVAIKRCQSEVLEVSNAMDVLALVMDDPHGNTGVEPRQSRSHRKTQPMCTEQHNVRSALGSGELHNSAACSSKQQNNSIESDVHHRKQHDLPGRDSEADHKPMQQAQPTHPHELDHRKQHDLPGRDSEADHKPMQQAQPKHTYEAKRQPRRVRNYDNGRDARTSTIAVSPRRLPERKELRSEYNEEEMTNRP